MAPKMSYHLCHRIVSHWEEDWLVGSLIYIYEQIHLEEYTELFNGGCSQKEKLVAGWEGDSFVTLYSFVNI